MPDQPSHLPPQCLEAEEAILGAMLVSTTAVDAARSARLTETDFYRPSHRTIYRAIMTLAARDAVDELTVVRELQHAGQLGEVGGAAAVMTLAERCPTVANARSYAQEVVDTSLLRSLVETGHAIAALGYDRPDEPARLLQQASQMTGLLLDRGAKRAGDRWVTLADAMQQAYDRAAERAERGSTLLGHSTGLQALDARWGGLEDGALVIVAARPGMGKSALGDQITETVAFGAGVDVARFSLEMDPVQQASRGLARHTGVGLRSIITGRVADEEWQTLHDHGVAGLREGASRIHLAPDRKLTADEIRVRSLQLHRELAKDGRALGLVLVDYLQLADGAGDNRTQQVSHITRTLKVLAGELDVPVIALSQLNRQCESRPDKRPMLSDLRESGSIEQDADVVCLLHRLEAYYGAETPPQWVGRGEVITAKCRNGEPGTDILGWEGSRTRFVDDPGPTFVAGAGMVA